MGLSHLGGKSRANLIHRLDFSDLLSSCTSRLQNLITLQNTPGAVACLPVWFFFFFFFLELI